jgi:hypothetical protein
MRYFIILICSSFLITGCFTMSTLDKAKQDRMPEQVKTVLTSYKDTSGNTVIIYKKCNRKSVYKAVVPLDTIISTYRAADKSNFVNRDSTIDNFKGVFAVNDSKHRKQLIVLFNNETPLRDTTGLYKEIEKNEHSVRLNSDKLWMPVWAYSTSNNGHINTKAASFIVRNNNKRDSAKNTKEKYVITFKPNRQKKVRYLLVPLTVGLDAVTWPVQLIIGLIIFSKIPIS